VFNNTPDLIDETILGRTGIPPYLERDYLIGREGIGNNLRLEIEVTIFPDRLVEPLSWKKTVTKFRATEEYVDRSFNTRSQQEAESAILRHFESIAQKLAPSLFEIDPRIGKTILFPFDRCPLFDPGENSRTPFFGHSFFQKIFGWAKENHLPVSSYPGEIPITPCPFCGRGVIGDSSPRDIYWGGGNIGWIHGECGPWLFRRPEKTE
jgi:hypothetical protein